MKPWVCLVATLDSLKICYRKNDNNLTLTHRVNFWDENGFDDPSPTTTPTPTPTPTFTFLVYSLTSNIK